MIEKIIKIMYPCIKKWKLKSMILIEFNFLEFLHAFTDKHAISEKLKFSGENSSNENKVRCIFPIIISPEFHMGSMEMPTIKKAHPTLQYYVRDQRTVLISFHSRRRSVFSLRNSRGKITTDRKFRGLFCRFLVQ